MPHAAAQAVELAENDIACVSYECVERPDARAERRNLRSVETAPLFVALFGSFVAWWWRHFFLIAKHSGSTHNS